MQRDSLSVLKMKVFWRLVPHEEQAPAGTMSHHQHFHLSLQTHDIFLVPTFSTIHLSLFKKQIYHSENLILPKPNAALSSQFTAQAQDERAKYISRTQHWTSVQKGEQMREIKAALR